MSEKKENPPLIALICPTSMPGVSTVMRNMEATKPDICKFFPIRTKKIKDLPQAFHDSPIVILGGWAPDFYRVLVQRRNGVSVLLCSSVGQMELSRVEMSYLSDIVELKDKNHIDKIITGSPEVYIAFRFTIPDLMWMAYPVDMSEYDSFKYKTKPINYVGFFMPMHYRKNIYNQMYGISEANYQLKNEKKTMNLIEVKTNGDLNIPGVNVTKTGWMEREKYLSTIKDMKVGLHVTFTESFGYGALDYLLNGTPVLMSSTVGLNLKMTEPIIWDKLVIMNPDSLREIALSVVEVLSMDEEEYKQLSMACWVHSREMAKSQNVEFARFIDSLLTSTPEIVESMKS